jgi:hypothetical protein
MSANYASVTAADLLRYIESTHPVGGNGNCLCATCEAYGIICHAAGEISRRRAEAQQRLADAMQEVTA